MLSTPSTCHIPASTPASTESFAVADLDKSLQTFHKKNELRLLLWEVFWLRLYLERPCQGLALLLGQYDRWHDCVLCYGEFPSYSTGFHKQSRIFEHYLMAPSRFAGYHGACDSIECSTPGTQLWPEVNSVGLLTVTYDTLNHESIYIIH